MKFFRDDSATLQYNSIASVPNKTYFIRLKQVKANPRPLDDLLDNLAPDTGLRYFEMTDFDAAYTAIRDISGQEDLKKRAEMPTNLKSQFINGEKDAIGRYLAAIHGISMYYFIQGIRAASGRILVSFGFPNPKNDGKSEQEYNSLEAELVIWPNRTPTFTTYREDGKPIETPLPQVMKSQGRYR